MNNRLHAVVQQQPNFLDLPHPLRGKIVRHLYENLGEKDIVYFLATNKSLKASVELELNLTELQNLQFKEFERNLENWAHAQNITNEERQQRQNAKDCIWRAQRFGGDLNLSYDTHLTELPQGLKIQGHLNLYGCVGLIRLPQGLIVEGNLNLVDCTSLIKLSQGLIVGGDLNLLDCMNLRKLPADILNWGLKNDGKAHHIELKGSGVSTATIVRLNFRLWVRSIVLNKPVHLSLSNPFEDF